MENQDTLNIDIVIPFQSTIAQLDGVAKAYVLRLTSGKPSKASKKLSIGRTTLYRMKSPDRVAKSVMPPHEGPKVRVQAATLKEARLKFLLLVDAHLDNSTAAASQLGIGRSTLYRCLNYCIAKGLVPDAKQLENLRRGISVDIEQFDEHVLHKARYEESQRKARYKESQLALENAMRLNQLIACEEKRVLNRIFETGKSMTAQEIKEEALKIALAIDAASAVSNPLSDASHKALGSAKTNGKNAASQAPQRSSQHGLKGNPNRTQGMAKQIQSRSQALAGPR